MHSKLEFELAQFDPVLQQTLSLLLYEETLALGPNEFLTQ